MNANTLRLTKEFYQRRLIELNPVLIVTPAKLVELNRQAQGLRNGMRATETNPVWNLAVRVEADGTSPTRFEVILEDPQQ
jgi:hypothetical protein